MPIKAEEVDRDSPQAQLQAQETAKYQANLGVYYWQKGELHQAIAAWEQEAEIHRLQGASNKEAEASLKIAQSYTSLGELRLAIFYLEKLIASVKEPSLIARTWEQLGNAYSRSGELTEASKAFQKSLATENSLSTLNNLVMLLQKQVLRAELQANSSREGDETERYRHEAASYRVEALKYAQQALSLSQTEQSSSSIHTLIEWSKLSPAGLSAEQLERGRKLLGNLSSSRMKSFLAINWAKVDREQANYWFSQAREVAEAIGDARAESFALLELCLRAEKSGNPSMALKYAQLAQLKAQSTFSFDSLYRAHWLAGRISQQAGNKEAALSNYRSAIAALDAFNQGLSKITVKQRLDFQEKIEPIYRRTLELLLEGSVPLESNLEEALLIFDKLRLAQLQQYFGDNCFEIEQESLPVKELLASRNAVLINSIILDEQTHFILQLPDGTLRHSKAEVGKAEITKIATEWYKNLKETNTHRFKGQSRNFYDLILRPFEQELEQINPSTLIFVHDGILRNLPMAALYDGENFLAQKWASVSSLGLNFKSTANQEKRATAVAFGLGVKRGNWAELAYVEQEIDNVANILGGKKFLNEDFTTDNFAQELNQERYSTVHLAAHAYFGGIAENSFILAYDKPLSALDLEDSLSQSKAQIELLVLSGCETAISSDRSALGLAGVALRSGVNYVLGSFWQVKDDEQLELMNAFYSNLQATNLDKAKALQQIQIEQIEQEAPPSKWAVFNLIES